MEYSFTPQNLTGTVAAIPSKSDAHRAMIAAALADRPTRLFLPASSRDIEATSACLTALGASMESNGGWVTVQPIKRHPPATVPTLDCNESGSTLRFLLPVATALVQKARLVARPGLAARPMGPLLDCLTAHGVSCSAAKLPLQTTGRLQPGSFTLPGDISSQYISGLLFALPLLAGESEIRLATSLKSIGYVEMTLSTLGRFGIRVETTAQGYRIPGNQKYRSPGAFAIQGDWSNAAFWLAAGALGGPVTVTGLQQDSFQRDKQAAELLERFGAAVSVWNDSVTVAHRPLRGITIPAGDIPDLVPALAVVAAFANGTTTFTDCGRLRIKESDRLETVCGLLQGLGVQAVIQEDCLVVTGSTTPPGGVVNSSNDHRIAMAAAVAAAYCTGPVTLVDPLAVEKSYPAFYDDYSALGGQHSAAPNRHNSPEILPRKE